ncbi:MAG: sensor histidine kinase [Bacteroidota bacterium]
MLKKPVFRFPLVFELLIWLLYICMYKYSYYLDQAHLPLVPDSNFPYLQICLYSICSTLYLIPYYRWAVPALLLRKRYWWLLAITLLLLTVVAHYNQVAIAWVFAKATNGMVVQGFFINQFYGPELNLQLTDLIAFLCIAFARFSSQSEAKRHRIETDHLQLQLSMLKTQLQPHFLFNTLNGLYGLSLSGSKDTPRFILLLSQMMQYILYDCDREMVNLADEITFLKGYFELEQQKFPEADILLNVSGMTDNIPIPPLLFLPLVENSFKHGKHKISDKAGVKAQLIMDKQQLSFRISNELMAAPPATLKAKNGGIGLVNIRKRLDLYYPNRHQLDLQHTETTYIATLTLQLA